MLAQGLYKKKKQKKTIIDKHSVVVICYLMYLC